MSDEGAQIVNLQLQLEQQQHEHEEKERGWAEMERGYVGRIDQLGVQLRETQQQLDALMDAVQTSRSSAEKANEEVVVVKRQLATARDEKDVAMQQLLAKSAQLDDALVLVDDARKKAADEKQARNTLLEELYALQNKERQNVLQTAQLQQKCASLTQQNDWLTSELQGKSNEFNVFRSEKTTLVSKLQGELEQLKVDNQCLAQTTQTLQVRLDSTNAQLLQTQKELQTARVDASTLEHSLKSELGAVKKLNQVLKQDLADRQEQLDSLLEQLNDSDKQVQEKLKQYEKAVHDSAEQLSNVEKEKLNLQAEIVRLRDRIQVADRLLAESGFSTTEGPSTVLTRPDTPSNLTRMQASKKTFTELYTDYVRLETENDRLRRENEQLRTGMEQIVNEVSDRTAHFQHIEEAYEALVKDANDVSAQLTQALNERETLRNEAKAAIARAAQAEKDAKWAHQAQFDAGRQVQALLLELAEHTGQVPPGPPIDPDAQSDGNVDVQDVITERLVAFKNIQELQSKNAELLMAIRKLSDTRESESEQRQKEEAYETLKTQYEELVTAVKKLEEDRERQVTRVKSLIMERDMYRSVANGASPSKKSPSAPAGDVVSTVMASTEEANKEVELIRTQFEAFKKESAQDAAMLQNELKNAMKESSELRVQLVQVRTQNQFLESRIQMLNTTIDQQSKEIAESRQRMAGLFQTISSFDDRIRAAEDEKSKTRLELDQTRYQLATVSSERDVLLASDRRNQEDRAQFQTERARLNEVIVHLQSLHEDLTRRESETHKQLERAKENLERELQSTRHQVLETQKESKIAIAKREAELKVVQDRMDSTLKDVEMAKSEKVEAEKEVAVLQAKVDEISNLIKAKEDELRTLRARVVQTPSIQTTASVGATSSAVSSSGPSQDATAVENEINQLKRDLEEAKREIERQKQHADMYRDIAKSAEDKLKSNTEAYETFKNAMEVKVSEAEDEKEKLEAQVKELSEQVQILNETLGQVRSDAEEAKKSIMAELEEAKRQVEQLAASEAQAVANQDALKQDALRQREIAEEATNNYETEFLKRAKVVEQLSSTKECLRQFENSQKDMETQLQHASTKLAEAQTSWEQQKQILQKQIDQLETRCKDLSQHNDLLHTQLEALGNQSARLAQTSSESTENDSEQTASDRQRTIEELREVIRYLRREKELHDYEREAQLQESRRLRQELDLNMRQLEEARNALREEQMKSSHGRVVPEAEYAELLEKSSQLAMVRESNTTLRDENRKNAERVQVLEKQSRDLTAQIEPLQAQIRNLQAEMEARTVEIKVLEEDNERWKNRTQQILAKYDKIDPVEHRQLKETFEKLQQETTEQIAQLRKQLDDKESNLKLLDEKAMKLQKSGELWKTRAETHEKNLRVMIEKMNDLSTKTVGVEKLKALEAEKTSLQEQLTNLTQQQQELVEKISKLEAAGIVWKKKAQNFEKQKAELDASITEIKENRKKEIENARNQVEMRVQLKMDMNEKKIKKLEIQNQLLEEQLKKASFGTFEMVNEAVKETPPPSNVLTTVSTGSGQKRNREDQAELESAIEKEETSHSKEAEAETTSPSIPIQKKVRTIAPTLINTSVSEPLGIEEEQAAVDEEMLDQNTENPPLQEEDQQFEAEDAIEDENIEKADIQEQPEISSTVTEPSLTEQQELTDEPDNGEIQPAESPEDQIDEEDGAYFEESASADEAEAEGSIYEPSDVEESVNDGSGTASPIDAQANADLSPTAKDNDNEEKKDSVIVTSSGTIIKKITFGEPQEPSPTTSTASAQKTRRLNRSHNIVGVIQAAAGSINRGTGRGRIAAVLRGRGGLRKPHRGGSAGSRG